MDSFNILIGISLFYCVLFFFDVIFKSCSNYPYIYFLKNTGLTVELFRISWYTTAFNRCLQKWGMCRPKLLKSWFYLGFVLTIILLPISFIIILKSLIDLWPKSSTLNTLNTLSTVKPSSEPVLVLEPMIPGVNIPLNDLGYYALTFVISTILHEMGHAFAAVREGVHINGIGLAIIFIIPVIYVSLDTAQLYALSPHRQLRILCAGVWHNLVLALLATLFFLSIPIVMQPFYQLGEGVTVMEIDKDSLLVGPNGLNIQDRIIKMNACDVNNSIDWITCLKKAVREPSPGFCVSSETVHRNDESNRVVVSKGGHVDCCDKENTKHLCFEYLSREDQGPFLPEYSCLPARMIAETSPSLCPSSEWCTSGLHCLRPSLGNITKLVKIERSQNPLVIFIGSPSEIYHTVKISNYVPRFTLFSPRIPEAILKMCRYISMISAGLAFVNVLPCFYMDGQHIVKALVNLLLVNRLEKIQRKSISLGITILGSLLLLLYCIFYVFPLAFL